MPPKLVAIMYKQESTRKKRINKKWLKRYGKKYVPKKDIVIANCGVDKLILCHPKYWDRFQQILEDLK